MKLQRLISLSQLLNAWVFGGWADETTSARAWRQSAKSTFWRNFRKLIDGIFFFDKDHCRTSYLSELKRNHLPVELRNDVTGIEK